MADVIPASWMMSAIDEPAIGHAPPKYRARWLLIHGAERLTAPDRRFLLWVFATRKPLNDYALRSLERCEQIAGTRLPPGVR